MVQAVRVEVRRVPFDADMDIAAAARVGHAGMVPIVKINSSTSTYRETAVSIAKLSCRYSAMSNSFVNTQEGPGNNLGMSWLAATCPASCST